MSNEYNLVTPEVKPVNKITVDKFIIDYTASRVAFWLNYMSNDEKVKSDTKEYDNFSASKDFDNLMNKPLPDNLTLRQAIDYVISEELKKEYTIV